MLSTAFAPALRRAPFALRRPFSSTTSASSLLKTTALTRPLPATLRSQLLARGAASSVSGQPGSQTLGHAAQNIREELGHSASDLAKTIAAGNAYTDGVAPSNQTFLGITNSVAHSVPTPYVVFGLAGGIPYLGASGATVYLAHQAGMATQGLIPNMDPGVAITLLDQALNLQTTYGAVMLSFLGALHWGFEFAGYGGHKSYSRLLLGAAPVVFGWSTLALLPTSALIAQWAGFTTLWWADLKATGAGWTPKWYSQYRFYLSILVGSCIIASLAATSYWGPVGGHGLVSHDLQMIRAERKQKQPETEGIVKGAIGTVAAQEDSDNYVMIKHNEPKEESPKQEQQKQQ
ncbi:uncharacterized protein BXZ73DRAFT_90560 [Epithele typhae]|uniref:uncharacterized protein n=1 Tax=Epithele typhae TaxID=378194 RepID=UPI0020082063|nr:uncharacterized protein BXZ73DRAFT_90560 [Epithele typhae]KAH9928486.1 hypothetical protein BXZ73DRAFT_90560 [Epithele typhae]